MEFGSMKCAPLISGKDDVMKYVPTRIVVVAFGILLT
jgi:hypothetical protein